MVMDTRMILRTIWKTASAWQPRKKAMALIQIWYESSHPWSQPKLLGPPLSLQSLVQVDGHSGNLAVSLTHGLLCRRRKL